LGNSDQKAIDRHSRSIRSCEHENALTSSLGAHIAQIGWQTSTAGIEVMDSTLKPLKAALEAIRDMASNALGRIEQSREARSMRWICKECRYVKHFTKSVLLETAGRCPDAKARPLILFYEKAASVRVVFFPGNTGTRPGASKTFH
jgi:hypothetical protein